MAFTLGAFCLAILIVSVVGGLLPLATVLDHTRLQVYLSFSAGTMLGAAFFHMLPEAVRVGSAATIPWAAFGLLALFFLERFFSFHHHEPHGHRHGHGHAHAEHAGTLEHEPVAPDSAIAKSNASPVAPQSGMTDTAVRALPWGSAAFGLIVHSIVGGVALASAVAADFEGGARLGSAGWGVFLATVIHKPADALTITSLMLRAGSTRRSALLVNFGFGLMIPVGVALFALGMEGSASGSTSALTAAALAFSAGTFLVIALSDLLPELQFHSHDRLKLSVGLLAGFALMAATALFAPGE